MPHQRDLFPPETSDTEAARAQRAELRTDAPVPVWYQRLSIVILVVFCFYVGLMVFVLPWTRYWQGNPYLLTWTTLGPIMNSGITRGIISGLGLLDVWIGVSEIIQYREQRS